MIIFHIVLPFHFSGANFISILAECFINYTLDPQNSHKNSTLTVRPDKTNTVIPMFSRNL